MKVPIVTAADQRFVPGLGALLGSLQRNSPGRPVFVLDCGIDPCDVQAFRRAFPAARFLNFTPPQNLPFPSVGSVATYARLSIGSVFCELERVIYLDSDVVVLSDLQELDHLSLTDDEIIAACLEPYTPSFGAENGVRDFRELGFDPATPYFNAGVMLVHVPAWNCFGVGERATHFLLDADRRLALYDQEALNVTLAGRWKRLQPEWNVSRYWMRADRQRARPNILGEARIVHFLSPEKPWLTPEKVDPWLMQKYELYARPEEPGS